MIESIRSPLVAMQQLLGKDFGTFFARDGDNLVAEGKTEEGLRARVTLHPDGKNWTLFLEKQSEKDYPGLVVDDVMMFSAYKKDMLRIKDFLEIHGITLMKSEAE